MRNCGKLRSTCYVWDKLTYDENDMPLLNGSKRGVYNQSSLREIQTEAELLLMLWSIMKPG